MMRRQSTEWWLGVVFGVILLGNAAVMQAACCQEGCGSGPTPWVSCGSPDCPTGGICPGPIGSAIRMDPAATCGVGDWASCPASEAGYCADGVNNDAWTGNTLADCADPACAMDPACRVQAPVVSQSNLFVVGLLLLAGGVWMTHRRVTR